MHDLVQNSTIGGTKSSKRWQCVLTLDDIGEGANSRQQRGVLQVIGDVGRNLK